MTPYPASLPLDDVQLIIDDIRGGTSKIVGDKAKFAKAIWDVLGYALKSVLGDPSPVTGLQSMPPVLASAPDLSDAEVAEHLERLLPHMAGVCDGIPIPWTSILKWAIKALAAAL